MKKILSLFFIAVIVLSFSGVVSFAYENAEWEAEVFDDTNYNVLGSEQVASSAIDGSLDTGWQKQSGIMNRQNGEISGGCWIALEWDNVMTINKISLWWRSSTRAQASLNGYVVQFGELKNGSVQWSDINATYAYERMSEQNGRYVCDVITPKKTLKTRYLRVFVKRGVDYVDDNRQYSPKLNEFVVDAAMNQSEQEELNSHVSYPSMSTPSVISSDVLTTEPSDISSNISSDISSNISSCSPEDVSSIASSISVSDVSSTELLSDVLSDAAPSFDPIKDSHLSMSQFIPHLIICLLSVIAIVASFIIIVVYRKK